MVFVILEGVDGAGKSSLAQELYSTMKNCRLIHKGPPQTNHLLREYLADIVWYRADDPDESNVVCDRWHLGESVYPQLQQGRTSLATRETLGYLDLWLLSRGALLVHVRADPTTVYHRRLDRGEAVVNVGEIHAEHNLFVRAVGAAPHPKLQVDTGAGLSTSDIAAQVMLQAEAASMHVAPLARFTTYVGPRVPDVLLVGDERGPDRAGSRLYGTAFVPLPHTSGNYLMRALPDDLLVTGRVGLANVNESDDVVSLWDTLGQPPVVALGHNAYDGCVRSGLADATTFGAVPHPQYVRRFHHPRAIDYGRMIVRAAETKEDLRKWPQ